MLLSTRHFGEIEIEEAAIIAFQEGLPGFEDTRRYALLGNHNDDSPFKWLQCVDRPELAFAIIDPFIVKKDYDIEVKDEIIVALGIEKQEEVLVFSIVVVPEDMSKISMNLKAPIIVNKTNRKGMQVILDTDKYTVRHYIMEELRGQEVDCDACADKKEGSVDSNK